MVRGSRVVALAPVYDMLPAQYAGQQGHLGKHRLSPPCAGSRHGRLLGTQQVELRLDLWRRLARHSSVSAPFRRVAIQNAEQVQAFRVTARLLPGAR